MSDDESDREDATEAYTKDLEAAAVVLRDSSGEDHDLLDADNVPTSQVEVLRGARLLELAEGIRKRRSDIKEAKLKKKAKASQHCAEEHNA